MITQLHIVHAELGCVEIVCRVRPEIRDFYVCNPKIAAQPKRTLQHTHTHTHTQSSRTCAPPTSVSTAKLVRWRLEQTTVTMSPSLTTLTVVNPSLDHVLPSTLGTDSGINNNNNNNNDNNNNNNNNTNNNSNNTKNIIIIIIIIT